MKTKRIIPKKYKGQIRKTLYHQEQKTSGLENFLKLNESALDTTLEISEQISEGKYHEITPTVVSFILSLLEALFEAHPKWFKSAKEQDKAIRKVEELSECFALIKSAFDDDSRETESLKSLIGYGEIEKLIKKRIASISAIVGLIFSVPTPDTVANMLLIVLIIYLFGIKIIMYLANDGHILIESYRENILKKELTAYECLAIMLYISLKAPPEPERKRHNYGRVIYEYEFVRELNNPKNYEVHGKRRKNFRRRKL